MSEPLVSVVIPTYNQAQYLGQSIQSALDQTYLSREIIVVDDGSTDETPSVVESFGSQVSYIRQENQGLAGARNTGIRIAQGEFVALLDSDDMWLPTFLSSLISLTFEKPNAAVYYCGVRYIDINGCLLPQQAGVKQVPPEEMYAAILRANHVIPSTVLMRRSVIISAGLFDIAFRRLQDWELWIRLLCKGYTFASLSNYLVAYRVHRNRLSVDHIGGQKAVKALVEKHFGPDDDRMHTWSQDKRRAYGGLYRYHLLTSIRCQPNWEACGHYLRRALVIDPTLAGDLELFYDLALGSQPLGYRGTFHQLDLENNADRIINMLRNIFGSSSSLDLSQLYRRIYGTAYFALGLVAYNTGQLTLSRRYLLLSLYYRPRLFHEARVVGNLVRSLLGLKGLNWFRYLRQELYKLSPSE
jgi:glycosyltransferase involved in cell wall biosynthesis